MTKKKQKKGKKTVQDGKQSGFVIEEVPFPVKRGEQSNAEVPSDKVEDSSSKSKSVNKPNTTGPSPQKQKKTVVEDIVEKKNLSASNENKKEEHSSDKNPQRDNTRNIESQKHLKNEGTFDYFDNKPIDTEQESNRFKANDKQKNITAPKQTHRDDEKKNWSASNKNKKEEHSSDRNPYRNTKNIESQKLQKNEGTFDYFDNKPIDTEQESDRFKANDKQKKISSPKQTHKEDDDEEMHKQSNNKKIEEFMALYRSKKFNFVKVKEIEKDLFQMPQTYALAHCVAEDMAMGSGIAVQFSQQFKRRDELYQQRQKQGGLAVLDVEGRFIYYLVTKRVSNGKPTVYTMWNSLQKLQHHIQKHNVKQLAIPRIGCGLDRLEWSEVKAMIEYTFDDTDVQITVCNYQQPEDDTSKGPSRPNKCPIKNVRYPLVEIEGGTAIIYFGTVNGDVSEDIGNLDAKFHIKDEYTRANKNLGDIISTYKNNEAYWLIGCITRKSEKDLFDFDSFQKCIRQIRKLNKYYEYVGIQAFMDNDDDLLLDKIINMLRNSLVKVEIYVCWCGKMISHMPPGRDFNTLKSE